ncbi:MAG TPA: butyrate kinase [Nitrospirota bacterium]
MKTVRILVINPGSTSTKLAYFEGGREAASMKAEHPEEELRGFKTLESQLSYRMKAVAEFMKANGLDVTCLDAIAARGGLMKPVRSGVYRVNERMVEDLRESKKRWGKEHAANLGAMMANILSQAFHIPAFTADPVTVDEMDDLARISGVPGINRKSHLHALNIKAVCRKAADRLGIPVSEANLIAAHVGGGITVAAVLSGVIVDVNNALLGMGPFSPQRAGALPTGDLIDLAYSGRYTKGELEWKLVYDSGFMGYLGTNDVREVEKRIEGGDRDAELVYLAMAYQVAKEMAAMAAVLSGRVDAIVVTGGVAHSAKFIELVEARAGFIASVLVYPGEYEMEALAEHARKAVMGETKVITYE